MEILEEGTARLEAGKVTFRQLAEYVKTRFYVPATYSEDGSKTFGSAHDLASLTIVVFKARSAYLFLRIAR